MLAYDDLVINAMEVGQTQILGFTGTATHGGGSCQLSLSTDLQPSKSSQFRVIYSIIGSCPSNGTSNNPSHPFNFKIPNEVPNGKYAFAWTWFNKVGNREMYVNCALVELSGSNSTEDTFEMLPDAFVGNIGNGCSTTENTDPLFPDPGRYSIMLGSGPFEKLDPACSPGATSLAASTSPVHSSGLLAPEPPSTQSATLSPLGSGSETSFTIALGPTGVRSFTSLIPILRTITTYVIITVTADAKLGVPKQQTGARS